MTVRVRSATSFFGRLTILAEPTVESKVCDTTSPAAEIVILTVAFEEGSMVKITPDAARL